MLDSSASKKNKDLREFKYVPNPRDSNFETVKNQLNFRTNNNFADYETVKIKQKKVEEPKLQYQKKEKDNVTDQRTKLRKVYDNYDEFSSLTANFNKKGRVTMLGNNVFQTKPKDVLPTLHEKTYFKACQTIKLNSSDPTQDPIFSSL